MLTGMPSELLCRIDNRPQDGFDADEHRGASPDIGAASRYRPLIGTLSVNLDCLDEGMSQDFLADAKPLISGYK